MTIRTNRENGNSTVMIKEELKNPSAVASYIGKDSAHYSFSKARRFNSKTATNVPALLQLPSTLDKRYTTFGLGKRWFPQNAKGRDSPSPDKYTIPSCFEVEKRGPSLTGNKKDYPINPRSHTPGPGAYTIEPTLCKDTPSFSFRPKFLTKNRCTSPPPGTYNPSYNLLEKNNFSEITFGLGERGRDFKPRPCSPGPGTYELPSFIKVLTSTGPKFYNQVKSKVMKNK